MPKKNPKHDVKHISRQNSRKTTNKEIKFTSKVNSTDTNSSEFDINEKLSQLKNLNLDDILNMEGVSKIVPIDIDQLANLDERTTIKKIKSEIMQIMQISDEKQFDKTRMFEGVIADGRVTGIYICNCKFRDFPPIEHFPKLLYLHINGTELHEIPDNFSSGMLLEELELKKVPITKIPSSISKLSHLNSIALISTKLNEFPQEILKLHNLEDLDLSYNTIEFIPSEIYTLSNLSSICIRGNKIHDLPDSLFKLHQLEMLYVDENQIRILSPLVSKLKNLNSLSIIHNPITSFPKEIQNLKNLNLLFLDSIQEQIDSILMNQLKKLGVTIKVLDKLPDEPSIGKLNS